jgi:hypothetical protein
LKGNLKEAKPLYKQALKVSKRVYGEEHAVVADSLNNLALLLREEVEPLFM